MNPCSLALLHKFLVATANVTGYPLQMWYWELRSLLAGNNGYQVFVSHILHCTSRQWQYYVRKKKNVQKHTLCRKVQKVFKCMYRWNPPKATEWYQDTFTSSLHFAPFFQPSQVFCFWILFSILNTVILWYFSVFLQYNCRCHCSCSWYRREEVIVFTKL